LALNEISRAANLPISIIVVKIGNLSAENDSTFLIQKSMEKFAEVERNYIEILQYDEFKKKGQTKAMHYQKTQFEHELMKKIPDSV